MAPHELNELSFQTMVEAVSNALVMVDNKGQIIYINHFAEELFQYKRKELLGKKIEILIPTRFKGRHPKLMEDYMWKPESRPMGANRQLYALKKDGSEFPVEIGLSHVNENNGNLVIASIIDITEPKKVEQDLNQLSERLALATLAGGVGIWDWDIINNNLVWDDQMYRLYGISPDQFSGAYDAWRDGLHPDDEKSGDEEIQLALSGKKEFDTQFRVIWKDKSIHYIRALAKIQRDNSGKPIRMIGTNWDITEQKKAERELKKSETHLQAVLSSMSDLLFIIDKNGIFIDYTRPDESKELYAAPEFFIGKHYKDIMPADVALQLEEAFHKIKKGAGIQQFDYSLSIQETSFWFSARISMFKNEKGKFNGISAAVRNVTEQIKVEQELIAAKEEAEQANKAKSVFLSNMSHELRTPLNAIIGFSQLLMRNNELTASLVKHIKTINKSGEHLLELINDILEMSKIEAGQIKLKETEFDFNALLKNIEAMFRVRTDIKGLNLLVEHTDDFPKYLLADEGKIRQVLINLIGNAVKFTDEGKITIRTGVSKVMQADLKLFIDVEDTGHGISEKDINKIFNYFEQITSELKFQEGSGLGLAISKQFAYLMGGDITVKSKPAEGSIFRFEFLAKEGKDQESQIHSEERVVGFKHSGEFKILIADDKNTNRELLANLLTQVGFTIQEAINGKEALDLFKSWKPDLILMDMVMPIMDGIEATRQIKSLPEGKDTVIITVTASGFEEDLSPILKSGSVDYVIKPFKEEVLFDKIQKHCKLDFIYEKKKEIGIEEREETKNSLTNITSKITSLPADLREKLQDAIESGYRDKMFEQINKVKKYDAKLSNVLHELIKDYNYNEIMKLLNS